MNTNEFVQKVQMAILAVFSVFVMSSAGWAATYYVDATNGNDNNDGLSISTAWETIAKVNSSTFQPGDSILLKRDEIWREQLIVLSSGFKGMPITYGAYGSGDKPVISAADVVANWSFCEGSSPNTHRTFLITKPGQVFMDDTRLIEGSDKDLLNDHEWFWEDGYLYLRAYSGNPDDTGHMIQASQRPVAVNIRNKKYITVDGIRVEKAADSTGWGHTIYVHNNSANIILQNITALQAGKNGIMVYKSTHVVVNSCTSYDNCLVGIEFWDGASDGTVRECEAYGNKEEGFTAEHNSDNVVFFGCLARDNGKSGFSVGRVERAVFRKCKSYGNGQDIASSGNGFGIWEATSCIVEYCIAYKNKNYGAEINEVTGGEVEIYNSVFYANEGYNVGIKDENVRIKNCILMDAGWGAQLHISSGVSAYTLDHNCYYATGNRFRNIIGATNYDSLSAWQAATGQAASSIISEPFFTDPSNYDFILQYSSPCINAGTDVGLSEDLRGTSIPQGDRVDLGAFEHIGIVPPNNFRIVSTS